MPRTPLHTLRWSRESGSYELYVEGRAERRFGRDGEEAWQAWLRTVTSFAFHGASGSLNVYQETRPRGGRYWYAYHTAGGRTRKHYLGRTARASLGRLEEVAGFLTGGPRAASPVSLSSGPEGGTYVALPDIPRGIQAAITLPLTKLAPPRLPGALVGRERLLSDLDAALSTPLTLVSASAGWGKTTLLAAWARTYPCRIAWLSLDALDDDLARFWTAVIASLRTCVPDVGVTAFAMLRSPQPPPITAIITALLNEFAEAGEQSAPILLLLDDYQLIREQAIHESLLFFLEHLPAHMHLLVSSRVDPDLPLARLRVRGQLTEIRAADLRFTRGDAETFLRQTLELSLTEEDVSALERRTEGWVAGLQIAALSLRKQEDHAAWLATFAGSHRYLLDYVQDEILALQPLPIQRFLLQVAVLTRMSASLCQAVTGEPASQEILETLERTNLFVVPLDEQRQWYRLHDLFREALLARVHAREPELLPRAHQQAAQWYAAHGEIREAIAHALAAQDSSLAVSLIEREAPRLWLSGEAQTVHAWLHALPDDVLWQYARLALDACLRLLDFRHATFDTSYTHARIQVEQMLVRIEAGLRVGEGSAVLDAALIRRRLRLLRALIESRAIIPRGDVAGLALLAEEIEGLTAQEEVRWKMIRFSFIFWHDYSIRREGAFLVPRLLEVKQEAMQAGEHLAAIRAMVWLALGYGQAGWLHAGEQECLEALAEVERLSVHTAMTGYLYFQLGAIYLFWNRLEEASTALEEVVRIGHIWQQSDLLGLGNVLLARANIARNRLAAADRELDDADIAMRRGRFLDDRPMIDAMRAVHWLAAGDLGCAAEWAGRTTFDPHAWIPRHAEALMAHVSVLIARREYSAAVAVQDRFAVHLDRPGDISVAIQFLALQVVALHHAGEVTRARAVAARLFAMTEPEGWPRVYLDGGAPMERVLRTFLDEPEHAAAHTPSLPRAYISRLLAAFEQEKHAARAPTLVAATTSQVSPTSQRIATAPSVLIEPLTRREQEVLRHLAAGASNQEIAEDLAISLATVKKHVSNLLGKLGAQSRTQAIARAREASLL